MSNSNALNRKLEESTAVGKEFEPIADLWSQFSNVMTRAGIPDLAAQAVAQRQSQQGQGLSSAAGNASDGNDEAELGDALGASMGADGRRSKGASTTEEDRLRRSGGPGASNSAADLLGTEEALPPGVAPGGGLVYGRDA